MATSFSGMKTTITDSNGTRTYQGGNVTSSSPATSSGTSGGAVPAPNSPTYRGSNGSTVYSTDSSGLTAPVLSNGNGTYTGGIYTGSSSSHPYVPTQTIPAPVNPADFTVTPVSTLINGSGQSVHQNPTFVPPPVDDTTSSDDQKNRLLADIGRSQLSYGVYQNSGRDDLAQQAHLNAENDRAKLQAMGIDPSQYSSNVDLTGMWKGGTPNSYNPSQPGLVSSSNIPSPQTQNKVYTPSQQQTTNQQTVPPPANMYQPMSMDQIRQQVHSQIQQQIQYKQNAAQAAIQQLNLAYNNEMQKAHDDRTLEDWKLSQTQNPYSGGTDYQKAMLSRNRGLADQALALNMQNQVGKISNDFLDYQNSEQANEEKMIADKIDQERRFDLQNKQYQLDTQRENFNEKHANDTLDYQKQSEQDKMNYQKSRDSILDNRYNQEAQYKQDELQFSKDKWADQKSQWQQEFGFKGDQAQKANQLENARLQQTKDYQGYLMDKGKTELQGNQATNGYASEILGRASTREEAYKYITDHASDITKDGANINSIMKIIDDRFPRPQLTKVDPATMTPEQYQNYINGGSPNQ